MSKMSMNDFLAEYNKDGRKIGNLYKDFNNFVVSSFGSLLADLKTEKLQSEHYQLKLELAKATSNDLECLLCDKDDNGEITNRCALHVRIDHLKKRLDRYVQLEDVNETKFLIDELTQKYQQELKKANEEATKAGEDRYNLKKELERAQGMIGKVRTIAFTPASCPLCYYENHILNRCAFHRQIQQLEFELAVSKSLSSSSDTLLNPANSAPPVKTDSLTAAIKSHIEQVDATYKSIEDRRLMPLNGLEESWTKMRKLCNDLRTVIGMPIKK